MLLMVLLTKTDPGRELTESYRVWVIAMGVKLFKAYINERLQHCHTSFGAWFSPLCFTNYSVNLQGGNGFFPLYWL